MKISWSFVRKWMWNAFITSKDKTCSWGFEISKLSHLPWKLSDTVHLIDADELLFTIKLGTGLYL